MSFNYEAHSFTEAEKAAGLHRIFCNRANADYNEYGYIPENNRHLKKKKSQEVVDNKKSQIDLKKDDKPDAFISCEHIMLKHCVFSGILQSMVKCPTENDIADINDISKVILSSYYNVKKLTKIADMILMTESQQKKMEKVFWFIHSKRLELQLKVYAREEKLEYNDILQIKSNDCMVNLTKLFFIKNNLHFSDLFLNSIIELSNELKKNTKLESAYTRTSYFQKFLHQVYDVKFGFNEHYKISSSLMRRILSMSRIHLSYFDIINLNFKNLFILHKKSHFELDEYIKNESMFTNLLYTQKAIYQNKKFIKGWKKKHLTPPLLDFTNEGIQSLLNLSPSNKYYNLRLFILAIGYKKILVNDCKSAIVMF